MEYDWEYETNYDRRQRQRRIQLLEESVKLHAKKAVSELRRVDELEKEIEALKEQKEQIVQVAYTDRVFGQADTTPLKDRPSFDYIDGTVEGLSVGDKVIAPTRYNRDQKAVVVSVGPRTYFRRLNKIVEVLA